MGLPGGIPLAGVGGVSGLGEIKVRHDARSDVDESLLARPPPVILALGGAPLTRLRHATRPIGSIDADQAHDRRSGDGRHGAEAPFGAPRASAMYPATNSATV